MNVLCLDHVCHQKTKSFDFLLDIMKSAGMVVDVFYYNRHYCVKPPREMIDRADIIVYLEFLPSRCRLLFPGKRTVFVPMYDNEWGSKWQWRRIALSGMGILSFSKRVSCHARKCGVKNLLEVQYFLDPRQFPQDPGEPKRVFLWERGDIGRRTAEAMFPSGDGYVFDIKHRDEFLAREDYLRRVSRCEVMVAPRRKEGIGMVFLEAMAMGKCVVAHNDATMNEYIEDGETGILVDIDSPKPVPYAMVGQVRKNICRHSFAMWTRWQEDVDKIISFINVQQPCRLSLRNWVKMTMAFPLFLAEGFFNRLFK